MDAPAAGGILRYFEGLPDPRAANVVHKLHDVLLERDRSVKIGVHGKRLKAGWDEHYLLRLLTG